jgi:hypothetical protein
LVNTRTAGLPSHHSAPVQESPATGSSAT